MDAAIAAPGPLGLPRLARAWWIAALAGLGAFAAHTLLGSGLGFEDFFNRWLYNVLILLGLAACVLRTARVRAERGAWLALTIGIGSWAIAELLFDFAYHGSPPNPSITAVPVQPECLVRRGDGRARLLRARSCRSVRGRAPQHRGEHGRDRHEPRLPARRHPADLGSDRGLLADRLEA